MVRPTGPPDHRPDSSERGRSPRTTGRLGGIARWASGWQPRSLGAVAVVVSLVLVVAVMAGSGLGSGSAPPRRGPATAGPGSGGIGPGAAVPPAWLTLYQQAATTCPGLPWSVLAAVGTVETDSGQSDAPGVWSGANPAGAEGPMQFEPATFAAYATVGPAGARPASPYDPVDAVYTAAALLCADGAGAAATLRAAIADYNHSDPYVNTVLTLSLAFGDDPSTSGTVVAALTFAARQLGTPYVWGGTGHGRLRLLGPGPGRLPPRRGSPFPGWPSSSSRPARPSRPGRPSSPGTSSSSAAARRPSTTSASMWEPAR